MNVTAQKFQSLYTPVCKSLARWNHRTTLPQSRPCGRASSLREGAGEGCTTHPTARKLEGFGRFSSPLRNSETVSFYHSSDDTPSASLRSAAPSEREPGTAAPFTQPPKNRNVAGDFHRPYGTQRTLHCTIHPVTPEAQKFFTLCRKERQAW